MLKFEIQWLIAYIVSGYQTGLRKIVSLLQINKYFEQKIVITFLSVWVLTCVPGAQKNCLIDTVLLSYVPTTCVLVGK